MKRTLVVLIGLYLIILAGGLPTLAAQNRNGCRTEVVTLRYLPAEEAARLITESCKTSVSVASNGKLVLHDSYAKVHNAVLVLRELDKARPIVLSTPLRLVVSVRITIHTEGQDSNSYTVSAERMCGDGLWCVFSISGNYQAAKSQDGWRTLSCPFNIIPTLLLGTGLGRDGVCQIMDGKSVSVSGSGSLQVNGWYAGVPLNLSALIPFGASLEIGKPTSIAKGNENLGKSTADYEVTLLVTKEKGFFGTRPSKPRTTAPRKSVKETEPVKQANPDESQPAQSPAKPDGEKQETAPVAE